MVRIILGVVVGFIGWSILWVGSDEALRSAFRDWYGSHQAQFDKAVFNQEPFVATDNMVLLLRLALSVIFSLMSGFLAVFISNENKKTTLVLGVLLLAVGFYVQFSVWSYLPVWFHILFLLLLIPVTMLGGKLKKTA